jgi:hypothetical protein
LYIGASFNLKYISNIKLISMKKAIFFLCLIFASTITRAQTIQDFFSANTTTITWLGIDYSHVKLVGDFSQFGGAGEKSSAQVRSQYFPAWNGIVLNEPEKYNLKSFLKKTEIIYEIDMVNALNSETNADSLETYKVPNYSTDQIKSFVKGYLLKEGKGLGVIMVAECLNKIAVEGSFYFVVLNMSNKEVLLVEKVKGPPAGFGLRNYWMGAVFNSLRSIEKTYYKSWKAKYAPKK